MVCNKIVTQIWALLLSDPVYNWNCRRKGSKFFKKIIALKLFSKQQNYRDGEQIRGFQGLEVGMCVYWSRFSGEKDPIRDNYIKALAHMFMETVAFQDRRVDCHAGYPGKLVVQFQPEELSRLETQKSWYFSLVPMSEKS